ncbi:hypothetical protein [Ilumatobacter nonamiensis]|uniref:hypothetical protein n=1 Tax=Ilumatobacter nonamiensis TaxID=467093 RepID=UPI00034AF5F3|nr:hypothetical protein [Ilumatobacter nonamiensis]
MNVFNTVYALRPEIDPMPAAERARIRESLFGIGHDNATRSVRARSESGAVVSTAPHGTRATAAPRRRWRPFFSMLKGAVGIAAAVAVGAVVWSFVSDDEAATVSESVSSAPAPTPMPSTAAPTTVAAPVRTPVSLAEPLLVPEGQLTVDEVAISPPAPGTSSMLISVPDGSTMWLGDFDGDPPSADGLEFEVVGAVAVGVAQDRSPDSAVGYQFFLPCGFMFVNDAPGAEPYRPEAVTLFEAMAFDANSALNVSMPGGFSIIDAGTWQTSFTAQYQVPVEGATKTARLVQVPNGSLAQLTFGGRQLAPSPFAGDPAYIESAPGDPNLVSIYWQDADTVFHLSSIDMTLAELESFVSTLEATTPEEWSERLSTPIPAAPTVTTSCTPQPSLGPTLDP